EGSGSAPVKVVFALNVRCSAGDACAGHPENWPDTPWDQFCATTAASCSAHQSPTFWDPLRVNAVITQRLDPTAPPPPSGEPVYADIDRWNVVSSFPSTGEAGVSPSLWLSLFNHTGLNGAGAN